MVSREVSGHILAVISLLLLALVTATPATRTTRTVAQCPDGSPPPCRAARAAPALPSLAVLPLESRTPDSSDVYLAEGISEAIATRLGRSGRLSVRSQSAAQRFNARTQPLATIGRELNAAYLVTGSLRRGGQSLRVSVELARASSGERLWGDQYDAAAGDVLRIEQQIAEAVATAISGRLDPAERARVRRRMTDHPQAYDRYLRGRSAFRRRSLQAMQGAWADFSAAIALDPSFAAARAQLAAIANISRARGYAVGGHTPDELLAISERETSHALRLDSTLAQAWVNLATIRAVRSPTTLAGVREAARRAIALDSLDDQINYVAGRYYTLLGETREGIRLLERAREADPFNEATLNVLQLTYYREGMLAAALAASDSLVALAPRNRYYIGARAIFRLRSGDSAGARADIALARTIAGMPPSVSEVSAAAAMGDTAGLDDAIARLRVQFARDNSAFVGPGLAGMLLARGDTVEALDVLEQTGQLNLEYAQSLMQPWLEGLAGQPRYRRIVARLRQPPPGP